MSKLDGIAPDEEMKAEQSRSRERDLRRTPRRPDRESGGLEWLIGLVLIAIGGLYLLQQSGRIPSLTNWWALFLLLPAVGMLSASLSALRRNGHQWTAEIVLPLLGSVLMFGLTAVFFFGLSLGWLWPLFLVAGGLLIIAGSMFVQKD